MDLIRSLLFVPGNNAKMLGKAVTVPADALIPDLEDSVPAGEKVNARGMVAAHLPALAGYRVFVRVNAMGSQWVWDDLRAVAGKHIEGISIGKMDTPAKARELSTMLSLVEAERELAEGSLKVIPWVESAAGVLSAREIAQATPRVLGLAFGAEDFTADMGIPRTREMENVATARAMVALAARAAGVLAFDTPEADFKDTPNLLEQCQRAKAMGFKGKFAIHPSQVGPINETFQPVAAEIEYARRVVQAYAEAERQGKAAVALDGKMIDTPVWKRAAQLLEVAEAMQRRQSGARP
ncbi:MAG: CoA ester lyase [Dehalococcoidia bacterium]|nr:CoA ester lyase [Dehalococcoidia bacterium]